MMENYMKLELLGKGCGGNCVFLVKNLTDNKYYAMKRIIIDQKDQKQNEKNLNEIEIFKSLKHPNLISYIESFIHKNKLCIIMELADGGDLSKVLKDHISKQKKIEEELIWNWFLQLCQALKFIHSRKILHRDIKCQNIFLMQTGQIKLGDFGISKVLKDSLELAKTPLGTPYFLSPEICSGNKYNFKTDMWMIGCVLYELSSLRKPFEADNLPHLMHNILHNDILPLPKCYSNELKNIINKLLCKEPVGRPGIREVFEFDIVNDKMIKLGLNKYYENWNDWPKEISPATESSPNYSLFNLNFNDLHDYFNSIDSKYLNEKKLSTPTQATDSDRESPNKNNQQPLSNKSEAKGSNGMVQINYDLNMNNLSINGTSKQNSCEDIQPKDKDGVMNANNINDVEVKIEKGYSQGFLNKSPMKKVSIEQQIQMRRKSKGSIPSPCKEGGGFGINLMNDSNNHNKLIVNKGDVVLSYHSNSNSMKSKPKEIEFVFDVEESEKEGYKSQRIPLHPIDVVNSTNYHQISIKYNYFKEKLGESKMEQLIKEIEAIGNNLNNIQEKILEIFGTVEQNWHKVLFVFAKMIVKVCYEDIK